MVSETLQNALRKCSGSLVPSSQAPPVLFQGQQELWRNIFRLRLQQLLSSFHFLADRRLQVMQFEVQSLRQIRKENIFLRLILKSAFFVSKAEAGNCCDVNISGK